MTAVVVNHMRFNVPVDELVPVVTERFLPAFDAQPGFHAFYFVREADDRAVVVIVWDSPEDAAAGSAALGPTVFNDVVVPRLAAAQERTVGPALVSHHRVNNGR
jgi:hypothetical protein